MQVDFLNLLPGIFIIVFVLIQAFRGIKGNIPGSKKIFFGIILSLLFQLVMEMFMAFYAWIFPYKIKDFIEVIITFLYFALIFLSAWGFKELIGYSLGKNNESGKST